MFSDVYFSDTMFSKACEYAIRAVLLIAHKTKSGKKLSVSEIANGIDSPIPFTAKILQTLTREGIISSSKGPNGGFFISSDSKPVPLNRIVEVIDGASFLHSCSLGLDECSDKNPCPIHNDVRLYKERLKEVFHKTTVQQLAIEIEKGNSYLKLYKKKGRNWFLSHPFTKRYN